MNDTDPMDLDGGEPLSPKEMEHRMLLWWSAHDSRPGIARHDGVTVELPLKPVIEGLPVDLIEVHYWNHRGYVRRSGGNQAEMGPEQCSKIESWLVGIANAVKTFITKE